MIRPMAYAEDLKRQRKQGWKQGEQTPPYLWSQLSPECRRQLAQHLAKMIQRIREIPEEEKANDERV
jgi:hypothetical protein